METVRDLLLLPPDVRDQGRGWDEGLEGMCVNEKRKLTIPPQKAYGV